ncbi:multidrug ABC transporter ATP-binding protein [Vagococcus penaei]|uniref:Multidrug ABC transporter ATP-binding protein n=1 Tax=Vagococcus penaei TaxID=633807 RepID=A0A1Q2D7P4_9ENTE|nr:ABC transporter ATP-binding protein [Vagococcus penaei]AQP54341.1 multidrug ABC transporter ATP-binding protein [Vagococcus penaei]RSU05772.1 multidrug ABC transporter ATP-binding protein [Vagococcus penaei]
MDIEITQLKMSYGRRPVLDIPELNIKSGYAYGLVGKNGAGKTTFFKCLTNIIIKYQGIITIDNKNVRENPDVLQSVGIVLDGMSVYQDRTGWFNIDYFSKLRGTENRQLAEQLALELEMSEYLHHKVKTYSYGMTKKLILLIALLHEPKLLILDEPFRGLDSETVAWFKYYLSKLTSKGMTLLISSHVKADIVTLCDQVMVLQDGRVAKILDLTSVDEAQLRDIQTTNQAGFIAILETIGYPYEKNGQQLRLTIKDDRWILVKQELLEQQIEITELIPVHVLDQSLN